MIISRNKLALIGLLSATVLITATPALAQTMGGSMFDDIENRYANIAKGWAGTMTTAASFLFWGLASISLVWTMGLMALRRAELGEFFTEFIRFVVFTGFFYFLLINGVSIADAIIRSLQQLGGNAAHIGAVTPGSIVDIGFDIVSDTIGQSSLWEPVDSAIGIIIACIILVVLALVGVNMLLLVVSGWILAFGGIFFLGFGGSRWTSDMAINYYKTVLGVAASLMAMALLVGIGKSFVDDYQASIQATKTIKDLAGMMVASVILLALVNKIPGMVAGIITGASVSSASSAGSFGAGAAMSAGSMAMAAAATGGAALAAGAAQAAGGGSAVAAAFKAAQANMASGNGMFSSSGSGGSAEAGGGGGGGSPMAEAMGGGGGSAAGGGGGGGEGAASAAGSGGDAGGGGDGSSAEAGSGGDGGGGGDGASADAGSGGDGEGASAQASGGGSGGGSRATGSRGAAATAALFGADMASHLAGAATSAAKAKVTGAIDAAKNRVSNTVGGRMASAIRDASAASAAAKASGSGGDTISASKGKGSQAANLDAQASAEIADFVNRA